MPKAFSIQVFLLHVSSLTQIPKHELILCEQSTNLCVYVKAIMLKDGHLSVKPDLTGLQFMKLSCRMERIDSDVLTVATS